MLGNYNGGIYFQIGLDNGRLKADSIQAENILKGIGNVAESEGQRVDGMFSNIGKGIAAAFTINAAQNFISQIVRVRGEIQALETSFTTLLGSKSRGDAMLAEIRKYAIETPYDLNGVSRAAQTMLAFNMDAEKVIPTLKQIGDIAMGDGQKMQSLVLAFSQMSSTGRLMGQDLLQMINAGFNPLVQISEKTGKSIAALKKEMEGGKISVDMVAQAFTDATSEGGKFYGMMEQQASGIQGSIAGLEDSIQQFYNELGEKNEGFIVDTIQGLTSLIENYEQVGRVIGELVAIYGGYRAALITVEVLHRAYVAGVAQVTIVQRAAAISQTQLTAAQLYGLTGLRSLTAAWKSLNATILLNPFVLAAAGLTALGYAIYKTATYSTEAEERLNRLNEAKDDAVKQSEKETLQLDRLFDAYNKTSKGTKEYDKAKSAIISKYGTQISQLQGENKEVWNLSEAYNQLKKSAIEAANARAYQRVADESEDRTASIITSQRKQLEKDLIDFYGGDKQKAFGDVRAINEMLNSGSAIPDSYFNKYSKTNYSVDRFGLAGRDNANVIKTTSNTIQDSIKSIAKAYTDHETEIKQAQLLFGIDPGKTVTAATSPTKNPTPEDPLSESEKKRLAREKARLAKETAERAERIRQISEQIAQVYKQTELEISQVKIEAMAEGFDKEMAQIDLNHQRMQAENDKRLNDALEKERDRQQLLWENDPTSAKAIKDGAIFDRSSIGIGSLSTEVLAQYSQFYALAAVLRVKAENDATRKIELEKEKKAQQTADRVADYMTQSREIEARKAMNNIENSVYNLDADRRRDTLTQELSLQTDQLDAVTEQVDKYRESLERLREIQAKNPSKETSQEIAETEAVLNSLILKIRELGIEIENLKTKIEKTDNERLVESLQKFSTVMRAFGGVGGDVGKTFTDLADYADQLSVVLDKSANSTEKYAAAAQMAAKLISSIVQASKNRKIAEDEFERNRLEFAHSYALALNEQLRLQTALSSNGFVRNYKGEITDAFAAMSDAAGGYAAALKALEEGQVKTGRTKAKVNWGAVASGAGAGLLYGSGGGAVGMAAGAVVGGLVGLFSSMKRVDIFGDLLDTYPDLIDAEGELNTMRAKALLDSGLLDEKTRMLVQNAIDWKDSIEAAREQISGIVSELAGDLGNEIQDALVSAWEAGEDASEKMFAAANKSLGNFVKNFLYSTVFSGIFDKFKERMEAALDPNGSGEDILDIYDDLFDEAMVGGEAFTKLLDEFQKRALERGFDISGGDTTRTGLSKGIAGLTQDQGNELNGRFTAIQGHTFSMMGSLAGIQKSFEDSRTVAAAQLRHLANIDTSTQVLPAMMTEMKTMRVAIETITERGVKML